MNNLSKTQRLLIGGLVAALAVGGYLHFSQFADYTHMSDRHVADVLRAKFWSMACLFGAILIVYWKRNSALAPYLALFFLSAYFVVLYGILYRGTEYGMNGHWGDNGYRLAMVCKMMAFNVFSDPYTKDLVSLYPPLWFYLTAMLAKIVGLEAWQTLKFGYLLVYLIYPWLIFFAWKPLTSKHTAAMVAIVTIFVGHKYLDYIYYEHIAAALFIPWWLYFFEDSSNQMKERLTSWRFYLYGSLFGAALFLTYYPWFFLAFASVPLTAALSFSANRSWRLVLAELKRKFILLSGIALLSAVYWVPLIWSALNRGFASSQSTWFGLYHANISLHWMDNTLEATLIIIAAFFLGYLWNYWNGARLGLLYAGGLALIIVDRVVNLGHVSIQTRKLLEFAHVFAMAPLAIGLVDVWENLKNNSNIRRGMIVAPIAIAIFAANQHTELYQDKLYKMGINQRIPEAELEIIKSVDYHNRVFLTNKYIETCYLSYFMFIPVSNVSTHLAGQFREREAFLRALSEVEDSEAFTYAFARNKYDKIDYVYLPYNTDSAAYELKINHVDFNRSFEHFSFYFSGELFNDTSYFAKKHARGVFESLAVDFNSELEERILSKYPKLAVHLSKD